MDPGLNALERSSTKSANPESPSACTVATASRDDGREGNEEWREPSRTVLTATDPRVYDGTQRGALTE